MTPLILLLKDSTPNKKGQKKQSKIWISVNLKLKWKIYMNNFQEHDFYGIRNCRPFLCCYVAGKKRAWFSNPVKNRVLESCSNIFFPLKKWTKCSFPSNRQMEWLFCPWLNWFIIVFKSALLIIPSLLCFVGQRY